MQSQVEQGSGEGSGEGLGGFGAEPGQVHRRRFQAGSRFREGLGGFGADPAEAFPALGFAARFRTNCKNKMLRLLGIPPKCSKIPFPRMSKSKSKSKK